MDKYRPIGFGEGDAEALEEWREKNKNNDRELLIVEFSNKEILVGSKDDLKYTRWIFNAESQLGEDIVDTHMMTQKEFNDYIQTRQKNENKRRNKIG